MTEALTHHLLVLEPAYRTRVWGGHRLKHSDPPIGECADGLLHAWRVDARPAGGGADACG